VPSPSRICNDNVGWEASTSGPAGVEAAGVETAEGGGAAGISVLVLALGVGLPNRCPPPENGAYFFLG